MTDYYVSLTGTDIASGGTAAAPWRTIRYATTRVPAGNHRILVGAGTFAETAMAVALGVSIVGSGSNLTIIQSSVSGYLISAESSPATNGGGAATFKDFKIDGLAKTLGAGILARGRGNLTFENIIFENTRDTGLHVISDWNTTNTNPPATYIANINIVNCAFINCSKDEATFSRAALTIGGLENATISGVTIQESQGYGIKGVPGWFKGLSIQNCNITVPNDDALWGADAAIEMWHVYENCRVSNVTSNQWFSFIRGNKGTRDYSISVENCTINTTKNTGDNASIEMVVSDSIIRNNYIVNPSRYGFAIWPGNAADSVANIKIYRNIIEGGGHPNNRLTYLAPAPGATINNVYIDNNVTYNCETPINAPSGAVRGITSNVYIRNNIFVNADIIIRIIHEYCVNFQASNNIFYLYNSIQTAGSSLTLSNNLTANPLLNLAGAKPFPFFEVSAVSPAINAGLTIPGVTDGHSGTAPDIGAKEYVPPLASQRALILGAAPANANFFFF